MTLKPEVVFVLPLCVQAAAVARTTPLPLRARGGRRGTRTREKSQKVQNLSAIHGLCPAVVLVDSNDEVQSAVALLFMAICQPQLLSKRVNISRVNNWDTRCKNWARTALIVFLIALKVGEMVALCILQLIPLMFKCVIR